MTMTVEQALNHLHIHCTSSHNPGWKEKREAWSVIRSHIERGKDVLTTPGEVEAWVGGFAACDRAQREVDDEMVERACIAFHELPFGEFPDGFQISQRRDMKAALIAALEVGK